MKCCSSSCADGTGKFFSDSSKRYLKQFRKKGLAKEQRLLMEGIQKATVQNGSILDIGCGIGGIHLTLLQQGARSAVGIDLAEGMLEKAAALARELGVQERARFITGDFATTNEEIAEADITVLDKVVCCYENVDALLLKSLGKTRIVYALSFPKPHFLIRSFFATHIAVAKMFRASFRPYWHDWYSIVQKIQQHGFTPIHNASTVMWDVFVFRRASRNVAQAKTF